MTWFFDLFHKKGIKTETVTLEEEIAEGQKILQEQSKNDPCSYTEAGLTPIVSFATTTTTINSGIAGEILKDANYYPQSAPMTTIPQPGPTPPVSEIKTISQRAEIFHKKRNHKREYKKCTSCKVIIAFHNEEQKIFYNETKPNYPPGMAGPNLHWNKDHFMKNDPYEEIEDAISASIKENWTDPIGKTNYSAVMWQPFSHMKSHSTDVCITSCTGKYVDDICTCGEVYIQWV